MIIVYYTNNNTKIFETYQDLLKDENFNNIKELYCVDSQINSLDNLPIKLKILDCSHNQITKLDNLPNSLKYLNCNDNQITNLDFLPKLKILYCGNNQIYNLDFLPNSLETLFCHDNQITNLDKLPARLKFFYCHNNQITSLNNLFILDKGFRNPTELNFLSYYNNPICKIVDNYFDKDLKKYNLWKQNYLKKFILKIENWFLECKYNPEYKYCQKFVMEGYNFYETNNKIEI